MLVKEAHGFKVIRPISLSRVGRKNVYLALNLACLDDNSIVSVSIEIWLSNYDHSFDCRIYRGPSSNLRDQGGSQILNPSNFNLLLVGRSSHGKNAPCFWNHLSSTQILSTVCIAGHALSASSTELIRSALILIVKCEMFTALVVRMYGSAERPPRVVKNRNLLSHPDDLRMEA